MNNQAQALTIENITYYLKQTTTSDFQQAEETLEIFKRDPSYILGLCQILSMQEDESLELVAALEFKNSIKHHWRIQSTQGCDSIHQKIISDLLPLLFSKAGKVADIMTEGVLIIANQDYPGRWNSLPGDVMTYLSDTDHNANLRIWTLVQGITSKYTYSEQSEALFDELMSVVTTIHKKMLHYAQGYLNQIQNSEGDAGSLKIYFKTFQVVLQIFYNINFLDIHPLVDDNLSNWMTIVKNIMGCEAKADLSTSQLRESFFLCKGEAVNCALLFARKHSEDFMPLIEPFAEEIWKICTQTSQDPAMETLIIHSLHFFKNFVGNKNFFDFFKNKLAEIFKSLIIPIMTPNESVEISFTEEPEAFAQILLSNREFDDKTTNCVAFIRSLNRFQTDGVYNIISQLVSEYSSNVKSKGETVLVDEIVCINLVCSGPVTGFMTRMGVSEINMPADIITNCYNQIVRPGLLPVFEHFHEKKNIDQLDGLVPVLYCYHLKFISNYRAFLEPQELIQIVKYSSYLLRFPNETLRKVTLQVLQKILSMNSYQTENNMDAPVDTSSEYTQYYLNKRKIRIKIDRKQQLFNAQNVGEHIEEILQNLNEYCLDQPKLEQEALACMRVIFNIMKGRLSEYNKPICIMLKNLFKKISQGFVYSSIRNLVECLGIYILHTSHDVTSQQYIVAEMEAPINELMKENVNDITTLLIQVYAVMIRLYKQPPQTTVDAILSMLFNENNYNSGLVSLYPSYSIFAQEFIRRNPDQIQRYNDGLMMMASKFIELRIDNAFFELIKCLFEVLSQNDLVSSGWVKFLVEGSMSILNVVVTNKDHLLNQRPLYFKELFLYICRFGLKYDFRSFFQVAESVNQGSVQSLLTSSQFHNFIEAFQKKGERSILILGLTKLLFEEQEIFSNFQEGWTRTFISLLKNLKKRKYGSKRSLRELRNDTNEFSMMKNSQTLQNRVIKDISGESGFSRIEVLKKSTDSLLKELISSCGDDFEFSCRKTVNFLNNNGNFLDPKSIPDDLKNFLDQMNQSTYQFSTKNDRFRG